MKSRSALVTAAFGTEAAGAAAGAAPGAAAGSPGAVGITSAEGSRPAAVGAGNVGVPPVIALKRSGVAGLADVPVSAPKSNPATGWKVSADNPVPTAAFVPPASAVDWLEIDRA